MEASKDTSAPDSSGRWEEKNKEKFSERPWNKFQKAHSSLWLFVVFHYYSCILSIIIIASTQSVSCDNCDIYGPLSLISLQEVAFSTIGVSREHNKY